MSDYDGYERGEALERAQDAADDMRATIEQQAARVAELEAIVAEEQHCLKHALLREETLKAERDAVRKALEKLAASIENGPGYEVLARRIREVLP